MLKTRCKHPACASTRRRRHERDARAITGFVFLSFVLVSYIKLKHLNRHYFTKPIDPNFLGC